MLHVGCPHVQSAVRCTSPWAPMSLKTVHPDTHTSPRTHSQLRIAVVGAGTGEVLQQAGVQPDYIPSKALGKTMGAELPKVPGVPEACT